MLNNINKHLILSSVILLSSCSYFHGTKNAVGGRDSAYLNAQSIPPLRIPPGLSSSSIHEEFPVSDRSYLNNDQKTTLLPPDLR